MGTGGDVAGNGEVEETILDALALGLLQLAASRPAVGDADEGNEEGEDRPDSALTLSIWSLFSVVMAESEMGLTLAEESSTAIFSSFNNAFSGLTVGEIDVVRSSILGVASVGWLATGEVPVGDVSSLATMVLGLGERLIV